MKAVILAGGMGSRLRPYTYIMPKAMLPVGDKPILEHIIGYLSRNRVKDLVVATAYHGKQIEDYFRNGSDFGVHIDYARARKPLGTAGQLKTAEPHISETFLAMNGDILIDVNIRNLVSFHRAKGAVGTVALRHYEVPLKYGIVTLANSDRILEWREKPKLNLTMNIGLYVLEPKIFSYIKTGRAASLEKDTFPSMIKKKERLFGYLSETEYYDVAEIEDLKKLDTRFLAKSEI